MILILSEKSDITTYHVVKWLECLKKDFIIITDEDEINGFIINGDSVAFSIKGNHIDFKDIEAYWYRRGLFNLPFHFKPELLPLEIVNDIKKERSSVEEILHNYLLKVPSLSSFYNSDINRICVLQTANEIGLKIPNFGVFNQKNDVEIFFNKYAKIVNKPIWNGLFANIDNVMYLNYTTEFSKEDLASLPTQFAPSLFMEYIEKKYELRVFFLNGECFTMAILSQNDSKTKVDFRKYNKEKPNRNESYLLPENIMCKITKLMDVFQLKTGSLDIIVTPDDDFVFLEINPIGQFLNVSHTCNFNLEKKIALSLSKLANENRRFN